MTIIFYPFYFKKTRIFRTIKHKLTVQELLTLPLDVRCNIITYCYFPYVCSKPYRQAAKLRRFI